jgi:Excalibur calcium-binding domain
MKILSRTLLIAILFSSCTPSPAYVSPNAYNIAPGSSAHQFLGTPGAVYDVSGLDRDCSDFATQSDAQTFFLLGGGKSNDRHGLDGDKDGIACEENEAWSNGAGGVVYNPPSNNSPSDPPPSATPPSSGQCWVNGYYRKDGTYVKGYWRKC